MGGSVLTNSGVFVTILMLFSALHLKHEVITQTPGSSEVVHIT